MEVKSNFDFDQIIGSNKPSEHFLGARNEIVVEVFPRIILFQVRIHSGKGGRHGSSSCSLPPSSTVVLDSTTAIVLVTALVARKAANPAHLHSVAYSGGRRRDVRVTPSRAVGIRR